MNVLPVVLVHLLRVSDYLVRVRLRVASDCDAKILAILSPGRTIDTATRKS
jgi:hypothetical protein